MIQKLQQSSHNRLGFHWSGRLKDNEFKNFVTDVEAMIAEQGQVRLLLVMDDPQDFTLKAAWDDFVFWIKHTKDVERLAIVGQKKWERWLELLENSFIHTQVRYYVASDTDVAWHWIEGA